MPGTCPGCGTVSRRVHSRYERRLLDTAIGGSEVVICLAVRRFVCPAADCAKKTFAEQVEGLASRYARRTPAVTAVLQAVALALGGRAGARLAERLAASADPGRIGGFEIDVPILPVSACGQRYYLGGFAYPLAGRLDLSVAVNRASPVRYLVPARLSRPKVPGVWHGTG